MKFLLILCTALLCLYAAQAQDSDCPSECPAIFKETCGYNGQCLKMFSSECALNAASCAGPDKWRKVHKTQCTHSDGPRCDQDV